MTSYSALNTIAGFVLEARRPGMIASRFAAINATGTTRTMAMAVSGERNVSGTRSVMDCQPARPAIKPIGTPTDRPGDADDCGLSRDHGAHAAAGDPE